jgi:hypothetical protein
MKTQRGTFQENARVLSSVSEFQTPGQNTKLPAWMIAAGFRSYTTYSNDVLAAQFAPGQPARQRVYAWIVRNSSGRQSEFAVVPAVNGNSPARPVDICAELDIEKGHMSRILSELEEEGWIRTDQPDSKRIYLIAQPVIVVPPAAAIAPEYRPMYDEWLKVKKPDLFNRKEKVLQEWNEVRKLDRKARDEYFQVIEVIAPQSSGVSEKLTVQNGIPAVQSTKSCGTTKPILIDEEANKKLASYEPATLQKTFHKTAAAELATLLENMQKQGLGSKLGTPNLGTLRNLLKHGEPESIGYFLADQFRARRDYFNNWGKVVSVVAQDIAAWSTRFAPPPEKIAPAADLTREQAIEMDMDALLRTIADCPEHEQADEWRAEIAEIEREHPAIAFKVRARARAAGGAL